MYKTRLKAIDYTMNVNRREAYEVGSTLKLHFSLGTFFKMLHRKIEADREHWSQ